MKSILQENKECYICGLPYVEDHHIFFGPLKSLAEKYGLKVWLCKRHHTGDYSPHFNRFLDIELKQKAQLAFLETHTMEEWMAEFGRNFL